MADFNLQILEKITLNNVPRDVYTTQTISGVNYIDNRILQIPGITTSSTTLFSFGSVNSAGTFTTGSFQYGRVTNQSSVVPVKLIVSSSTEAMSYLVNPSSTFMLTTTKMTGSTSLVSMSFSDIVSVKVAISGSSSTGYPDVNVEYFIATT
jgi:hypothetical protein